MYIVAIAWMYVILMMSITEESIVAGVMTFLLYGVLPLTVILYLGGTSRRKRRRALADAQARELAGDNSVLGSSKSEGGDENSGKFTQPEPLATGFNAEAADISKNKLS